MTFRYTFTVFTPTYNRARTLPRVYNSLKQQTLRDFEWLIVDDGSTDETSQLVGGWQKVGHFPIQYIWQKNMGKHVAFNRGVQEARGEFFLTLDSDDACVPEALERFKKHWDDIPDNRKPVFSAVTALCVDQHGRLVGDKFPADITDSDSLELRYKFKVSGEKWGFQRTDVLKQYPFPQVQGVKFIPEGIVWNAIATRFKTRFVNEPLRIYWVEYNKRSDQLSRPDAPAEYAAGRALAHQSILNHHIKWFRHAPVAFLRSAINYSRFSFHARQSIRKQFEGLTSIMAKVLWFLMLPSGYLFFYYTKRSKKILRYWKSFSQHKHPVKLLAAQLLMRFGISHLFTINKKNFALRFYPTSLSAALWIDHEGRNADVVFYQSYLKPKDIVIDVGANIGELALTASVEVGQKGKVLAIEPHPVIYRYLEKNVIMNKCTNITLFNVASGYYKGTIIFSNKQSDDQNEIIVGGGEGIEVPIETIDDLFQRDTGVVDLLKVDVEGYEKFVFRGAREILNRTKCVYFESWERHFAKYGYHTYDITKFLRDFGFSIYKYKGTKLLPIAPNYVSEKCENLLAIRDIIDFKNRVGDVRIEVIDRLTMY